MEEDCAYDYEEGILPSSALFDTQGHEVDHSQSSSSSSTQMDLLADGNDASASTSQGDNNNNNINNNNITVINTIRNRARRDPGRRVNVKVVGEQIGHMSPEQLRRLSTLTFHFTEDPAQSCSLSDPRAGVHTTSQLCASCGLNTEQCKGSHWGTIEHVMPQIFQIDAPFIERVLWTVCSCGKPLEETGTYSADVDIMIGVPCDAQCTFFPQEILDLFPTAFGVEPMLLDTTRAAPYPVKIPQAILEERDMLERNVTFLLKQQTAVARVLIESCDLDRDLLELYPRTYDPDWWNTRKHMWLDMLREPSKYAHVLQLTTIKAMTNTTRFDKDSDLPPTRQLYNIQRYLHVLMKRLHDRSDAYLVLCPTNILQGLQRLEDEHYLQELYMEGRRCKMESMQYNGHSESESIYLKRTFYDTGIRHQKAYLKRLEERIDAARRIVRYLRQEIDRRTHIYQANIDYHRNRGTLHTVMRKQILQRLKYYYTDPAQLASVHRIGAALEFVNTPFKQPYRGCPKQSFHVGVTKTIEKVETRFDATINKVIKTQYIKEFNHDTGEESIRIKETRSAPKKVKAPRKNKKKSAKASASSTASSSSDNSPLNADATHMQRQESSSSGGSTATAVRAMMEEDDDEDNDAEIAAVMNADVMAAAFASRPNSIDLSRIDAPSTLQRSTSMSSEASEQSDVGSEPGSPTVASPPPPSPTLELDRWMNYGRGDEPDPQTCSLDEWLAYEPYQDPVIEKSPYWFSGTYTFSDLTRIGRHHLHHYDAGEWKGVKRLRPANEYEWSHRLIGEVYRSKIEESRQISPHEYAKQIKKLVTRSTKATKRLAPIPKDPPAKGLKEPPSAFIDFPNFSHSNKKRNLSILKCSLAAGGCGADQFHTRVIHRNAFQFLSEYPSKYCNVRFLQDPHTRSNLFELFSHRILARLHRIPDAHLERLGCDVKLSRPEWLVHVATIVPAVRLRPRSEQAEFKPFWDRQNIRILAHEEDQEQALHVYSALTGKPYAYGSIHEERFAMDMLYSFIDVNKWISFEVASSIGDVLAVLTHSAKWSDPKKPTGPARWINSLFGSNGRPLHDAQVAAQQHALQLHGLSGVATSMLDPAEVGLPPMTEAEQRHIQKFINKIFTHTMLVKPHSSSNNQHVINFLDGKMGFYIRHAGPKRVDYTSRMVLTSTPRAPINSVVVGESYLRTQYTEHPIYTRTQIEFYRNKIRHAYLKRNKLARDRIKLLHRTAKYGMYPSQADFQSNNDMWFGDIYPHATTIAGTDSRHEQLSFSSPSMIISQMDIAPIDASTYTIDGMVEFNPPFQPYQPSTQVIQRFPQLASIEEGGDDDDENDDGKRERDGERDVDESEMFDNVVKKMQPLSYRARQKLEMEMQMVESKKVMLFSLTEGGWDIYGRNPSLHRFSVIGAYILRGNVESCMGSNEINYPPLNADNDGDVLHMKHLHSEADHIECQDLVSSTHATLNIQNRSNVTGMVGDVLVLLRLASQCNMYLSRIQFRRLVRRIQLIRRDVRWPIEPDQAPLDPNQCPKSEEEEAASEESKHVPAALIHPERMQNNIALQDAAARRRTEDVGASIASAQKATARRRRHNHVRSHLIALHQVCDDSKWSKLDSEIPVFEHTSIESFLSSPVASHRYEPYAPNDKDDEWTIHVPPPAKPHLDAFHVMQLVDLCLPRNFAYAHGAFQIENGCLKRPYVYAKKYYGLNEHSIWKAMHLQYDDHYVLQVKMELQSVFFELMESLKTVHSPKQLYIPFSVRLEIMRKLEQFRQDEAKEMDAFEARYTKRYAVMHETERRSNHDLTVMRDIQRQHHTEFETILSNQASARNKMIEAIVKDWMNKSFKEFAESYAYYSPDLLDQPQTLDFLGRLDAPQVDAEACRSLRLGFDEATRLPVAKHRMTREMPMLVLCILSEVKGKIADFVNMTVALHTQTIDGQPIRRGINGRLHNSAPFNSHSLVDYGYIERGFNTGLLACDVMAHAVTSRDKVAASSLAISGPGQMNTTLSHHLGSLSTHYDGSILNENGHMVQQFAGRNLISAEALVKTTYPLDDWILATKDDRYVRLLMQYVYIRHTDRIFKWNDVDKTLWQALEDAWLFDTESNEARSEFDSMCRRAADRWINIMMRVFQGQSMPFETPFIIDNVVRFVQQQHTAPQDLYIAPPLDDVTDHWVSLRDEFHEPWDRDALRMAWPELQREGDVTSKLSTEWWNDVADREHVTNEVDSLIRYMHHVGRFAESIKDASSQHPFADLEAYVREQLCSVRIIRQWKLTHAQLVLLIRLLKHRFAASLVVPGTPIGSQTQHAAAEVMTQMLLRVFHFIDKMQVQEQGGVSHFRSRIQLKEMKSFIIEVALREPEDVPAMPGARLVHADMKDEELSRRFAQIKLTDVVNDVSWVTSRYYVRPPLSTQPRTLSEQRATDIDLYGRYVAYVALPVHMSRHNMPNEYQAFQELQKDFIVPDTACRVVLKQTPDFDVLPLILNFCSKMLNIFRIEIWRHQPTAPSLATVATAPVTYVLYVRLMIPRYTMPEQVRRSVELSRYPMKIFQSSTAAAAAAEANASGDTTHAESAVALQEPTAVGDDETSRATALLMRMTDVDMVDANTASGPATLAMYQVQDGSLTMSMETDEHTNTLATNESVPTPATPIAGNSSIRGKRGGASTSGRGRGRGKRGGATTTSGGTRGGRGGKAKSSATPPVDANGVPLPPKKPGRKRKVPESTPLRMTAMREEEEDDEDAVVITQPLTATVASNVSALHNVASNVIQARPTLAVAPTALSHTLVVPRPASVATTPTIHTQGNPLSTAAVSTTATATTNTTTTTSPKPVLCIKPFRQIRPDEPELHTETVEERRGYNVQRNTIDIYNTELFVQERVIKTFQSILPHTGIASIQMVRRSTAAASSSFAPFHRHVLRIQTVAGKTSAGLSKEKLLAFLARPEFDQSSINIRYPNIVNELWGISAFENCMIDELTRSLQAVVDIDPSIPRLIAARMSYTGQPLKMSQRGAEESGQNYIQRSLNHASMVTLTAAAQTGDSANFNAFSSAISIGKRPMLGTGAFEVIRKMDMNDFISPSTMLKQQEQQQMLQERIEAFRAVL